MNKQDLIKMANAVINLKQSDYKYEMEDAINTLQDIVFKHMEEHLSDNNCKCDHKDAQECAIIGNIDYDNYAEIANILYIKEIVYCTEEEAKKRATEDLLDWIFPAFTQYKINTHSNCIIENYG